VRALPAGICRSLLGEREHGHRDPRMTSCLSGARSSDVHLPPGRAGSQPTQMHFTSLRPGTDPGGVHLPPGRAGSQPTQMHFTSLRPGTDPGDVHFGAASAGAPCMPYEHHCRPLG
jgi:hypothetical protein